MKSINNIDKNINGIVAIKNNKIVFEKYYNDYTANNSFHIASATKTILGALIGIAIDKKYIKSIDEKVIDFFPEYTFSKLEDIKNKITLRNLLTMTVPYNFEDWKEPLDKLTMSKDWVKYTLDSIDTTKPIGQFKYSTAGAHLLSAILTKSTGESARSFANKYLFNPIGTTSIPYNKIDTFNFDTLFGKDLKGWAYDPNGNNTGGWGLTLTTRDMALFGSLYLNNGIHNNKQIISKSWVNDSIKVHEGDNDFQNYKYGYLWWLQNSDNIFSYSAIGDGGNIICCIPEKDLVVAISSNTLSKPFDRWTLIKDYIFPEIL